MSDGRCHAEAIATRFDVSRESRDRLEAYASLLAHWQARINLIGTVDASMTSGRGISPMRCSSSGSYRESASRLADLGSGAGIPGLVLAIARPIEAHLFESNLKKAAFLREAARQTGAARRGASPCGSRRRRSAAETIKAEVVTARALAPLPKLLDYAAPFLENGAIGYFHKGQDVDAELTDATKSWKMQVEKHPSMTDSRGVILVVKEAHRVPC